jgi:hypothetical protein
VQVVYPAQSDLQTINHGETGEFSALTRDVLGLEASGPELRRGQNGLSFVVSDILMQILLRDSRLNLKTGGYVKDISHANFTDEESENLYQRFLSFVDGLALSEHYGDACGWCDRP